MASLCSYCKCSFPRRAMAYLISDLGEEMYSWVETKLPLPIQANSSLCETCFESLTKQWSALQEPEVEPSSLIEVKISDPLSAGTTIKKEELDSIKQEYESNEDFDLNEQLNELQTMDEIPNTQYASCELEEPVDDSEENFENSDKSEGEDNDDSDSDSDSSEDDDSAELNPSKEELEERPPLLDGKKLNFFSKCDSCNKSIYKLPYRKLTDGPEKTVVAMKRLDRDRSPERVCPPCWEKARATVKRNILNMKKKLEESKTIEEDVDNNKFIKIPGYQRVARTATHCIVKRCKSPGRFHTPATLRKVLLRDYNIFASDNTRVCATHRKEYYRDWSCLKTQTHIKKFSTADVQEMLDFLREEALKLPE